MFKLIKGIIIFSVLFSLTLVTVSARDMDKPPIAFAATYESCSPPADYPPEGLDVVVAPFSMHQIFDVIKLPSPQGAPNDWAPLYEVRLRIVTSACVNEVWVAINNNTRYRRAVLIGASATLRTWEVELTDFNPGEQWVQVGANVGYWYDGAAQQFFHINIFPPPPFIWIEPDGFTLSWNRVTGDYWINVNGNWINPISLFNNTQRGSIDLRSYLRLPPGTHQIQMSSRIFTENYWFDSVVSNTVTFTQAPHPGGQLFAPTNLHMHGPVLSWSTVPNALSYRVTVVNTHGNIIVEQDTQSTSFNLLIIDAGWEVPLSGQYFIHVTAIACHITFTNSALSALIPVMFPLTPWPPAPVITLEPDGVTLAWDKIADADRYGFIVNGSLRNFIWVDSNEVRVRRDLRNLLRLPPGTHQIQVVSSALVNDIWVDSVPSNTITFVQAPHPGGQLATPTNINISGAFLTWNAVPNATDYWVYVRFADGEHTVPYTTDKLYFNLNRLRWLTGFPAGATQINIHAMGDWITFTDSNESASAWVTFPLGTSIPQRLDAPVLTLNGNLLTWPMLRRSVNEYQVYINGMPSNWFLGKDTIHWDISYLINELPAGATIQLRALPDSWDTPHIQPSVLSNAVIINPLNTDCPNCNDMSCYECLWVLYLFVEAEKRGQTIPEFIEYFTNFFGAFYAFVMEWSDHIYVKEGVRLDFEKTLYWLEAVGVI